MSHGVPMACFHQRELCEAGRKGNGREPAIFAPFWTSTYGSFATGRLAKWRCALPLSMWMQGKKRPGMEGLGWSLSSICHTQQNILFKVLWYFNPGIIIVSSKWKYFHCYYYFDSQSNKACCKKKKNSNHMALMSFLKSYSPRDKLMDNLIYIPF